MKPSNSLNSYALISIFLSSVLAAFPIRLVWAAANQYSQSILDPVSIVFTALVCVSQLLLGNRLRRPWLIMMVYTGLFLAIDLKSLFIDRHNLIPDFSRSDWLSWVAVITINGSFNLVALLMYLTLTRTRELYVELGASEPKGQSK